MKVKFLVAAGMAVVVAFAVSSYKSSHRGVHRIAAPVVESAEAAASRRLTGADGEGEAKREGSSESPRPNTFAGALRSLSALRFSNAPRGLVMSMDNGVEGQVLSFR